MVESAAPDRDSLKPPDWWVGLSDEKLLEVRMSDLKLSIEGTEIEQRIDQVNSELQSRGLRFRPR
jgi:hypothetical protein